MMRAAVILWIWAMLVCLPRYQKTLMIQMDGLTSSPPLKWLVRAIYWIQFPIWPLETAILDAVVQSLLAYDKISKDATYLCRVVTKRNTKTTRRG